MLYVSADGTKRRWFWNSRDGVTPYGTSIDGESYYHALNKYTPTYHGFMPDETEFVWVDYTPEAWADMMRRKWEYFRNSDGPYGGEMFLERFPTAESFAATESYRAGEPRQLSRGQFLDESCAWYVKD